MRLGVSRGLLCLTLAACGRKADIIISDGMVWTGLSTGAPQRGAVAIAGAKVLAIGDSAQAGRYAGRKTQWIQANGGRRPPRFPHGTPHFLGLGLYLAPGEPP